MNKETADCKVYGTSGLSPMLWGTSFWQYIHYVCFMIDLRKLSLHSCVKNLFDGLCYLIPCPICRDSYCKYYEANPLPESGIFEWSVMIHNKVNVKLNKPEMPVGVAWRRMKTLYHPSLRSMTRNILIPISLVYPFQPSPEKNIQLCLLISTCCDLMYHLCNIMVEKIDIEKYDVCTLLLYIAENWGCPLTKENLYEKARVYYSK